MVTVGKGWNGGPARRSTFSDEDDSSYQQTPQALVRARPAKSHTKKEKQATRSKCFPRLLVHIGRGHRAAYYLIRSTGSRGPDPRTGRSGKTRIVVLSNN